MNITQINNNEDSRRIAELFLDELISESEDPIALLNMLIGPEALSFLSDQLLDGKSCCDE